MKEGEDCEQYFIVLVLILTVQYFSVRYRQMALVVETEC